MKIVIKKTDLEVFLLAIACICFLSPFAQRTVGTPGIVLIIGTYLFLRVNYLLNCKKYERNTLFLIVIYISMLLLYSFIGKSDKGAGQTNSVLFFLTYFLIVPIYKYINRRQCRFIMFACISAATVTIAQNYLLFIRMGRRYTQRWSRLGMKEVINTQYLSAILFFSGALFAMYLCRKDTKLRILYLILSIICFIFNVVVTQRMTFTILSIVMLSLLPLVNGKVTRNKIIRYLVFITVIIFAVVEYEIVLNWIARALNSERMSARINSILRLLSTMSLVDAEGGSLFARIRLIGVSINTFFSSPSHFLFGVGDKSNNLLVGNHSYFFDEFAKFGIFGGLLSCSILVRMCKTARIVSASTSSDSLGKMLTVLFITFVLRSLTGGILAPAIGTVLFIFIPVSFRLMKYDAENCWEE